MSPCSTRFNKKQQIGFSGPAVPIVLFTDPGADLDDDMAMIFARYLVELSLVEVLCVIAVLRPSFERAQLARGTLDMIGMQSVPVGYGSDGGDSRGQHEAHDPSKYSYMPLAGSERALSIECGRALLHRVLTSAEDSSVSLVVIASLKDAALFLRDNETLFVSKVHEVVIMGGVEPVWHDYVVPDTAHNNVFDDVASAYFYRRCQELGVRLIVVGRSCAYAVPVSRGVYEALAATGSPIGWRLRMAQRSTLESLWRRAAADDKSGDRRGLPARCDREWFRRTFCGGDERLSSRGMNDHVWDLVCAFNMYDTLAIVAAVPLLRRYFFTPIEAHTPNGATNLLIGISEAHNGFASTAAKDACEALLSQAYRIGLTLDQHHHNKSKIVVTLQARCTDADELCGLAVLRSLVEFQLVDLLGIVLGPHERYGDASQIEHTARALREALDELGLSTVPLKTQHASQQCCQLEEIYMSAPPEAGVRVAAVHSLTLVADFAARCPQLFREKTVAAICFGGIDLDPTGVRLRVDAAATNVGADLEAAEFFTKECQAHGVPLCVVSRHLAASCQLPKYFFEELLAKASPLGRRVRDHQRDGLADLWAACCLEPNHPRRGKLDSRCDRRWFIKTFLDGSIECDQHHDVDDIWPLVQHINVYAPLVFLAAVPLVSSHFFISQQLKVGDVCHSAIGSQSPCARHVHDLRNFLARLIVKGVAMNTSVFHTELGHVDGLGAIDLSDELPAFIDLHQRRDLADRDAQIQALFAQISALPLEKDTRD